MAYNREWDRGKQTDAWNEGGNWDDGGGRGYVRGRDEEDYQYGGEGKRRKYNNNDGYEAPGSAPYGESNYTSPGTFGGGSDSNDWGSYEERHQQQRGGGFQQNQFKKRLVPSEPSPHVIFLGLDTDFTEADLQKHLTQNDCSLETVTIIRDRSTGLSKGFGFAQFTSTEHARKFVDPNFPFISVPPPASHGASATANFYRALAAGAQHNGRRVKIDFSQSANPSAGRGAAARQSNDGTRDIGNTQSAVLLFRGLDLLSGTPAVEQAMRASSGPGKEGAKGMKRIILIKDKVTMASWGFAFVEFVDIQSASTVLGATMSPQLHPSGFRISDRPVAASFAHPYSFQPLPENVLRDETCLLSSANLGGVEGVWVKYWDEAATAAVLEFQVEEPVQTSDSVKEKRERKKTKATDSETVVVGEPAPSALPVSDKPVMLSFNKAGPSLGKTTISASAPSKSKVPAPLSLGFSYTDDPNAPNNEDESGELVGVNDNKVNAFKKVAPLIASKKVANNINKWNQVQGELSNKPSDVSAAPAASAALAPPPPPKVVTVSAGRSAPTKSASPGVDDAEFEFSDVATMKCLLCARQFKSLDQLKRHNNESDLHKKNYTDSSLREVAREKGSALRQGMGQKPSEQPKYRDRAFERRILHNQPDTPMPEQEKPTKRRADGPPPPPSPPPPPVNPGEDGNNVGNKLLKMMGWTEGSGLGTTGEGRVEPIQTAIYAQGAGLGASKGKEVGKYADGYSGYVHMAKDAARERYES